MGEAEQFLHFLFVSFPGQGHVNPLLRLAKRVAAKGPLVTFTTTADFGQLIRAAAADSSYTSSDPIPVGRGHLRFEFFNDGADPSDPDRNLLPTLMSRLETNGPPALSDLIRLQSDAGRPVFCLVSNPFIPWSLDVAASHSIPSAVLWVQSAAVFSTYFHFHRRLAEFPNDEKPEVVVRLPGIPAMAAHELPNFLLPSNPYKPLLDVILAQFYNISRARWVFANTFEELERDAIEALADVSPLIPVGPLVDAGKPREKITADMWKPADHCLEWLDSKEPNSVVYVSVGSIVMLSADEMAELAFGLRNSGRYFLWVVREDARELLPAGYEEEIAAEGKGILVGWSPQEKVLASKAVGCFLTHCGWNSTLEVIAAGVPVVAFPQWGDQVPDAKFLCEVYGVGVRLPGPVTKEAVERCVATAMEGAEADRMRKRAAEWRELARAAVADGGSSDQNIEKFVDDVRKWVAGGGGAAAVIQG